VLAGGGACTQPDLRYQLESNDPSDRVRAIHAIAESDDVSMAPALVDRLDDEDPAVRFYAILALEKLTGTRLGYTYTAHRHERLQSVQRWRTYLSTNAAGGGPSGD
jgi:hypothetical protein